MSSEALEKDSIWTPKALYDGERTGFKDNGLVRSKATAETTVRHSLLALPCFHYSLFHLQDANVVVVGGLDACSPDGVVQRRLKARHVQMVSYTILCERPS
jgi:hypothetical protein